MRISDWSSDVCSSDLDGQRHQQQRRSEDRRDHARGVDLERQVAAVGLHPALGRALRILDEDAALCELHEADESDDDHRAAEDEEDDAAAHRAFARSEEHTSELQSLMRNSYAVFCLK